MKSAAASSGWIRPVLILILVVAALGALLVVGYLPRRDRERALVRAAAEAGTSLPQVTVERVRRSQASSDLVLPGNVTPITEALINARASGYVKRRLVDIGDRVPQGQVLAEIEAPELDQQVGQAQASVAQAKSVLSEAQHNLNQAVSKLKLAQVTAERWRVLVAKGVVSRHESDQKDADYEAQKASVESAQAAIRAAADNVQASEANLRRLVEMQAFEKVTAPFAGIVTARNVDVGALISATGGQPMFRMAQIDVLRIMVEVPQTHAPYIRVGQAAVVTLQELPGRMFPGRVSRTANTLDLSTRTLPTEVQVQNPGSVLLPNMFARVRLIEVAAAPSVIIPGDALIVRSDGTQVAVVDEGNRIHFRKVEVGRDFGDATEVRAGLTGDEFVVVNPTDDVREGAEVKPVKADRPAAAESQGRPGTKGAGRQTAPSEHP